MSIISKAKVKNGIAVKEVNLYQVDGEVQHTEVGEEMLGFLNKFQEIENKNKCLRVQFLDWLSDKLLDWSNKCHVASVKIDSPCIIKVEPRTKEQSNDAKERKEIARLKELLAKAEERENKLLMKRVEEAEKKQKETA